MYVSSESVCDVCSYKYAEECCGLQSPVGLWLMCAEIHADMC